MRTNQEEADLYMAIAISRVFLSDIDAETEDEPAITWEDFQEKLGCAAIHSYFKTINVDISKARGVFDAIDSDGSGTVDAGEIVDGCLRLKGNAKALDVALLP